MQRKLKTNQAYFSCMVTTPITLQYVQYRPYYSDIIVHFVQAHKIYINQTLGVVI